MDYSNSQYYHKPGGPSSSAYQAYPNVPPQDHISAGPGDQQWPSHPQHIQAIPAPQPKTAYEPPVFSTFQDRKRAKELARRQGSGDDVTRTQSPAQFQSISEPPTAVPTRRPLPQPVPPIVPASPSRTPSPIQAVIERSDTISSIRSLDRVGFPSGRRPLPKPPVGVNSSRSLDRGVAPRPLNTSQRRQPSTVEEETLTPSPTTPYPSIVEPSSSRSLSPAKFNQLPVINFPDEDGDGDEIEVKEPTGIAVSLVPIIQISQDTAREQTGALLCKGCNEPIIGRFVNAMGQRWHPHCFKCNTCGDMLEHVSSYEAGGKAYCHLDYHNEFANQCFHCKTPIVDARFVTLDDPMLGQRFYHELHFFCSECGDPFLDPSKSSAPGAGGTDDGETDPFVIHKGHPYCEKCHLRLHKPRCKKCTLPIPDVAVAAMGAKWHRECFVCASCGRDFPNGMFFPKDGLALCTECWEQSA